MNCSPALRVVSLLVTLCSLVSACGPDDNAAQNGGNAEHNKDVDMAPGDIEVPAMYAFESRFKADTSSVSYSGQSARHALITGLNDYVKDDLQNDALTNSAFASAQDFKDALLFYYEFDSDSNADLKHTVLATGIDGEALPTTQTTYAGVSSNKDLKGKFAGNDSSTDHRDWSTSFKGWQGQSSAEGLLLAWMDELAAQAFALSEGTAPDDPASDQALEVYVTPQGLDLKQLIQKFLLMAVAFSQGADDYLDDDTEGKGLLADNTRAEGEPYTPLEHAWDEGFGYFGAARDFDAYSDAQIAANQQIDSDEDGSIDLTREYNFGASVNAAKRDLDSAEGAKTDFTQQAFDAFKRGRTLIVNAGDEVSAEELNAIRTERDAALAAWEGAIAATVVHYINDTLREMADMGEDYSHAQHAKVWSELKGFSLGFQFNPRSPMLEGSRFEDFHALIGDAPVLPSAEAAAFAQYKTDLIAARDILKQAYGFDEANLGDEGGEGGW